MYYNVCPIGIQFGKDPTLTYHSDLPLSSGDIVEVPFGRQKKLAIVLDSTTAPSFKTKDITEKLQDRLASHLVKLALWMSDYYATPLPLVLQTVLPRGLAKNRRAKKPTSPSVQRDNRSHTLTAAQKAAITTISESSAITHLLHGVTGSGKTRVYQELTKQQLQTKKSVLILVPEIALTPQLSAEFEALHNNVLILHSGLSESQRHQDWQMLSSSNEPWVVVGPRSILFSPLTNLGLIVVDECHEPSYQQDSQPKYSALRVARKLAELSGHTKLVLGSATPLVTDYFFATSTDTPISYLSEPTQPRDTSVEVIDMRKRDNFGSNQLFSKKLLEAMSKSITRNEQILLFHNRRGSARLSLCNNCGWQAECRNCHLPMRLHEDQSQIRCHICGLTQPIPNVCPECRNPDIIFRGFGSKRIEAEVKKLFPESIVARFDSDTPINEQLHNRYQDLYDNKINILIGTQGVAKGLDLPHLRTVGIVQADSELFIADYSSAERSFQLTTQVIGRAGRTGAASRVIIQTLNPDHPAITYAAKQDYAGFYEYELAERTAEHMPPRTYLLQLTVGYASSTAAERASVAMKQQITQNHPGIHVRGPAPAFHEHRGKLFYQQLVVSSSKRSQLTAIARTLPQRWNFTLDPINLL